MPTTSRRERARLERRELILRTARELAEAEGWGAVTTRRLAEAVDYSQPVLYGHFKNMNAIADAVAIDGIEELIDLLRNARRSAPDPVAGLRALAGAYLDYAFTHPAVYEAIFVRPTDLEFASADSPLLLKTAFGEIQAAVEPFAGDDDPETLTEVFWSALHGQATLNHARRLRPTHRHARVDLLVARLSGNNSPNTAE
ncbi:TetR/AcrR family transcriptional regulator [Kribbella shirazensis]|uniref:AcrR family transcriptional regulator n=1 Tax=Kribbella shirazensis TaxID=1105143 RepID=A0A7X6A0Y1_9ACTN|nr:TetR/AcrR family transcriptional regulator [Kribbella shirazensis]NIK57260.1 AcrR family transcriptional regulator [Kribbella shirazensis]